MFPEINNISSIGIGYTHCIYLTQVSNKDRPKNLGSRQDHWGTHDDLVPIEVYAGEAGLRFSTQ